MIPAPDIAGGRSHDIIFDLLQHYHRQTKRFPTTLDSLVSLGWVGLSITHTVIAECARLLSNTPKLVIDDHPITHALTEQRLEP